MAKQERLSFEEALSQLESIVERLDKQETTLEEAVKYYDEGLKLSHICNKTLEDAVLKIEEIEKAKNE